MKNRGRILVIICVVALLFFLGFKASSLFFDHISQKIDEKFNAQVYVVLAESEKEEALMDLYELRGRVEQISRFHFYGKGSNSYLTNELTYISYFQDSENPYLKNFAITITASDVGDICKEIFLQIDYQIYQIRFGTQETQGE